MDISSGINRPINIYKSNSEKNTNLAAQGENKIYGSNIFSSEFSVKEAEKIVSHPNKKRKKTRRLNTIDSDFLPDEAMENNEVKNSANFFVENKINPFVRMFDFILRNIPLINYVYLKRKKKKIQKTVEKLNNIVQNADELMNTTIPYGEGGIIYQKLAQNLTDAAGEIGRANKDF